VTRLVKKDRALFLKINDSNDILFSGTPGCRHCCSIVNANSMVMPDVSAGHSRKVSTHQSALGLRRGLWAVLLMYNP
jgi:hypothetical protein